MTDSIDDLAAIRAELATQREQLDRLLNPVPLAAVPPVTIGELVDVPAPGSPIASQWAQEVTNRVMQRFLSVADRNTKWSGRAAGSISYRGDAKVPEFFDGAAWKLMQTPRSLAGTVAGATIAAGATSVIATIGPVPVAGTYLCFGSFYADSIGVIVARLHLSTSNVTGGSIGFDTSGSSTGYIQATLNGAVALPAGGTAYWLMANAGGSPLIAKSDPLQSRSFALFGFDS